jgi:transposase
MILDLKNLPSDTKLLHQIISDLTDKVSDLTTENSFLKEKLTSLKNQLALLKKQKFSNSSEKIDLENIDLNKSEQKKLEQEIADLELQIEEEEEVVSRRIINDLTKESELDDNKKEKNKPKRNPLPNHLPREDNLLNPDPICNKCGSDDFKKIADDISETLDYIPSSFKVIRTIRPRCACINCENIVQADLPKRAITKGKAEDGLLAHILVQKYCNHLPYYRQSEIYEREENLILARSTMASWAGQCSRLLNLVIDEIKKEVFSSSHIHGDDTIIKVLAPGNKKTKTARLWVYTRNGNNHNSDIPPAICYFYSPNRKGENPKKHLENYKGVFHADAYSGYDKLYQENSITESACWAHTRRKFYEVTVASDKANIAFEIIIRIGSLYKIEEEIRGYSPNERLKNRQQRSKILIDDLFKRLNYLKNKLPTKSTTNKAINYALNHQEALQRFLTDGKIEIDNNIAENAIRPIAIGRKNWLFAGSDNGGEIAANIYTITETCKINKINPQKYLKKVFSVIQGYKVKDLAELLPWRVKLD